MSPCRSTLAGTDISTERSGGDTIHRVWWRRPTHVDSDAEERFQALGIMVMRIDRKLDRLLELLEDDDGWQEEEEADRP